MDASLAPLLSPAAAPGPGQPAFAATESTLRSLATYGTTLLPSKHTRRPPTRPDAPLACTLCEASLERTAYAMRTRLCLPCMRAPTVADGQRFCQRCHRLHPLAVFVGPKHSCEAKLSHAGAARKERRRPPAKSQLDAGAGSGSGGSGSGSGVPTPSNRLPSPTSSSPPHNVAISSEFVVSGAQFRDILGDAEPSLGGSFFLPYGEVDSLPWLDFFEEEGAAGRIGLSVHSAHLKLPHADASSAFPSPPSLALAVRDTFSADARLVGAGLRAGCLLLTLDFLLEQGEIADRDMAARLSQMLRPMLSSASPALRDSLLRVSDICISIQNGTDSPSVPLPAPARPLFPAHHITSATLHRLSIQLSAPLPASCVAQARALGLSLPVAPPQPSQPLQLLISTAGLTSLLREDARGALLMLEVESPSAHGEPFCHVSAATPLLLCANQRVVAEVNALPADTPGFEQALCAVALGLQPGSALGLRLCGAAAAARLRLSETLYELLRPRGGADGAARAAVGKEGAEGEEELAVAMWLQSVQEAALSQPRLADVAQLCAGALNRTGWTPLLTGAGWGDKSGSAIGFGAAKGHALALFRAARAASPADSAAMAAMAAEAAARGAAGQAGGEKERAAVPFLRALTHLLCAGSMESGGEAAASAVEVAAAAELARSDTPFFNMLCSVFFGGMPYLITLWVDLLYHALSGNALSERMQLTPEVLHEAVRAGPLPIRFLADLYVQQSGHKIAAGLVIVCVFVTTFAPRNQITPLAAYMERCTAWMSLVLTLPHLTYHVHNWQRWRLHEVAEPLIFSNPCALFQLFVTAVMVMRASRLPCNLGMALLAQRGAMLLATLIWPHLHVLPTSGLAPYVVPLQLVWLAAIVRQRRRGSAPARLLNLLKSMQRSGPVSVFAALVLVAMGFSIARTIWIAPWLSAEGLSAARAAGQEVALLPYLKSDAWSVLLAFVYLPLDRQMAGRLPTGTRQAIWLVYVVGLQLLAFAWSLRFYGMQLPMFHWTAAALRFFVSVQCASIYLNPTNGWGAKPPPAKAPPSSSSVVIPPSYALFTLLVRGSIITAAALIPGCLFIPPFATPAWAPWGGKGFQQLFVALHAGMFFALALLYARKLRARTDVALRPKSD